MASGYDVLKDFAGSFATVVAAIAAALVTFHFGRAQMRNSAENLRATRERTVLDLFDRRWAIVQDLRQAIGEISQLGSVTGDAYRRFAGASGQAAFLFGPEVAAYLEAVRSEMVKLQSAATQARSEMVKLQSAATQARSENDRIRARGADREAAAMTEIMEFFNRFDALIKPYMAMHQKLP